MASCCLFLGTIMSHSQEVDYSIVSVPEESGVEFRKITSNNDFVCMPEVRRTMKGLSWYTNRILDVSADGNKIAYLSIRGETSNVFVKDLSRLGTSVQRTNRKAVLDFSYSHDGKLMVFSEKSLKSNIIFQTDASNGFICRQITNGSYDYSPIYSKECDKIFFTRAEATSTSIWIYNLAENYLSSYTIGMNPCVTNDSSTLLCVRVNGYGLGEIWKVDYQTGVEECIISDIQRSFSTPSLSPDGQWVLMVCSTPVPCGKTVYWNTDIAVCKVDGSSFMQLTYHVADDVSPVWSKDGKYIYFISQRGDADASANVWRMSFNAL